MTAYACEPDKGSEPAVGWSVARSMAKYHDIWVLTRANNRSAIEDALGTTGAHGLNFVYFDLPRWLSWWKRGGRGVQLYYYLWQLGAWLVARELHRRVGFDLVHHVTFVKYWAPSLAGMLPIPFVWGPVGGGDSIPGAFRASLGWRGSAEARLRDAARWLAEHDPLVLQTARRSKVALATTPETARRVARLGAGRTRVFSQVGLHNDEVSTHATPLPSGRGLRLVSVSRLIASKGLHLSLKAFAAANVDQAEYWIVGDGPERHRLEGLANELGVLDNVRFLGTIPRSNVAGVLASCDVLVHPSLQDSGGYACLEGMAAGLPVVCFDTGGPSVIVTDETGFRIRPREPAEAVNHMAHAIEALANEQLRRRMGQAALKRARQEHSWQHKAEQLHQLYIEATLASSPGPDTLGGESE